MSVVRNILAALICASSVTLIWDGLLLKGCVAGVAAIALALTARSMRPGETQFLISVIPLPLLVAAIPALWIALQSLPLGLLAHPIWKSAANALHRPIAGSFSIDPAISLLTLGFYLSLIAIAFVSAAVAVDRQRAESLLLALMFGAVTISMIVIVQHIFSLATWRIFSAQAVDCVSLGTIIATSNCLCAIERYESRNTTQAKKWSMQQMFILSIAALTICAIACALSANRAIAFATGYGLFCLLGHWIVRRFALGWGSIGGLTAGGLGIAVLLVAAYPTHHDVSVQLAYAQDSQPSDLALNQRMLDDTPLVGTGAGTFAALVPIYRQINDAESIAGAATTAAQQSVELGKPMFSLIVIASVAFLIILLRASLRRGRDSFYSAMGGSCLITLLLLVFIDASSLATATGVFIAAILGVAFAQSRSRIGRTTELLKALTAAVADVAS
jgi:hypothetical protein